MPDRMPVPPAQNPPLVDWASSQTTSTADLSPDQPPGKTSLEHQGGES